MYWDKPKPESVISVSSETHFPAHGTIVLNTTFHGALNDNARYIATVFSPDSSLLMGGPAMVSINSDLKCTIAVTNTAPFSIYLQRGAIIGLIKMEDISDNIVPLSNNNVKAIISSITNGPQKSENLTHAHIKSKANLNVPDQFKSKYVDILFKHRAAISIGKHDLGCAKNFQHRIYLKDNCPVYQKQFKIPDLHYDFLTNKIAEWLKLGVVRQSSSMYNSLIFCVPKKMVRV